MSLFLKNNKIKNLFISLFVLLFLPGPLALGAVQWVNPIKFQGIEQIIDAITGYIWTIVIILAPLFIMIAGVIWLTAAGRPEKIKQAKDIIVWTVVGFTAVLFVKGIMSLIIHILGITINTT